MKILIISGKARHGKNTFADILQSKLESKNKKVIQMAYGDLVKYVCNKYFGATYEHNEENRYIWQNVGTNRVRENLNMPNYWVDKVCDFIKMTEGMYDYIIIIDARFINEIEIPKSIFKNVETFRVIRPNFNSGLTEKQLNHVSETQLDNYEFDNVVYNTSLEKLNTYVDNYIKKEMM